jgi:hypothetical protein
MSKLCLTLRLPINFQNRVRPQQQPFSRREAGVRCERHRLTGAVAFPRGAWPRRMCAAHAAAYCGELSIEAFMKRVGKDYPLPRVKDGRRQLWLRDDLDKAILPSELVAVTDIAEDL